MSQATEATWLEEVLSEQHLFQSRRAAPPGQRVSWRIGVRPHPLTPAQRLRLQEIGDDLWALLQAELAVYQESLREGELAFVAAYLDAGKPEELVRYSRMKRLRQQLPAFIRPDLLLVDGDFVATEIDSVPGGFGELAALQDVYSALGHDVLGGPHGIIDGFVHALGQLAGKAHPSIGVVVSDESEDYRAEMQALARALQARGEQVLALAPRDVQFREDGLYAGGERLDVLYRFFELFDLRNIPKAELFLYAQKKGTCIVTPPIRPQLEEKLWFALLHHPLLSALWQRHLGADRLQRLRRLLPSTHVLDPRPLPPHAVVPDLSVQGRPVQDMRSVGRMGKREREAYVIKPSGFSELAWGSRGVHIGEDHAQEQWQAAVQQALAEFPQPVWLLQRFHKAQVMQESYYDFVLQAPVEMAGRTRLCPYFFRDGAGVSLGGVLATTCPADKKVIHGMVDAIMSPAGAV